MLLPRRCHGHCSLAEASHRSDIRDGHLVLCVGCFRPGPEVIIVFAAVYIDHSKRSSRMAFHVLYCCRRTRGDLPTDASRYNLFLGLTGAPSSLVKEMKRKRDKVYTREERERERERRESRPAALLWGGA